MADITDAGPVAVGDEVIAVGRQGDEEITLAELAHRAGTIDYELCTLLMPRVPRRYKE
jgi:alanine racemase